MDPYLRPDHGPAQPSLFVRSVLCLVCLGAMGISLPVLQRSMDSNLLKLFALVTVAGLMMATVFMGISGPGVGVPRRLRGILAASLAVAVFTAARVMLNPFTAMSLNRLFIVTACTALFFSITCLEGRGSRGGVLSVIVCAGAPALLVSALMGLGMSFGMDLPVDGLLRNPGTLGNANLLGSYSAALLLPGLFLIGSRKGSRTGKTAVLILFSTLCGIPLIQSGTRGSLLALCATLVPAVVFLPALIKRCPGVFPDGRRTLYPVLITVLSALCASLLFDGRWRTMSLEGGTAGVRLVIWRGALEMFLSRPFTGWGEGTFQAIFPLFRSADYALRGVTSNTVHAHSEIMELAAESGLAGLFFWGVLIALWWRQVTSRWRRWTGIDLAALSGVVFLCLESLVSISLRWTSGAFLLSVFAAVPLVGREEPRVRFPGVLSLIPLIGAVFLLAFGVPTVMNMIESSRRLHTAVNGCLERVQPTLNDPSLNPAQARDSALVLCRRAEDECSRSLALCPWDYGSWYTLGNARLTSASILALEYPGATFASGAGLSADITGAFADAKQALAAYDSLAARAGDFSDLRHNRIIALVKVGEFDMAMADLAVLHSDRTHYRDFCESVARLISPFTKGCGYDAFNAGVILERYSGEEDPGDRRAMSIASGLMLMLAVNGHESGASADSLALVLAPAMETLQQAPGDTFLPAFQDEVELAGDGEALLSRISSGSTDGLYSICLDAVSSSGTYAPYHRYALCVLSDSPRDRHLQDIMRSLSWNLVEFAPHRMPAWPGRGDHFVLGVRMGLETCPANMELLERLFNDAWFMDCFLSSCLNYAMGSYASGSLPSPVDSTFKIWVKLGGPLASIASGLRGATPLVPGGIMHGMLETVMSAAGSRPDSTELWLFLLGLRFRTGSMDLVSRAVPHGREGLLEFDSTMVGLIDNLVVAMGRETALEGCSRLLSRETGYLEGVAGDPRVSVAAGEYRSSLLEMLQGDGSEW